MRIAFAPLCGAVLCSALAAQEMGSVPVMISFKDTVSQSVLARYGITRTRPVFGAEIVVADVAPSLVLQLRRDEAIEAVEIDHVASAYGPGGGGGGPPGGGGGGGGGTAQQVTPPGITRVGGTTTSAGVTVAIVDTGIDLDHPELQANIVGEANFVKVAPADDDNGHGTHCSGIVAAIDNTIGVVGVVNNASLLAVKVLDRRGSGSYSAIVSGINWAAANGADVISMSLGGSASTGALQNACNSAAATCLLVAAAGNDGDCNLTTNEINYPAYYGSVLSVGATSVEAASYDALMCFSSSNPDVELSAPGYNINSTWKGGGYNVESGTSMACPHVAGCAAALWNGNPNNVRNTLINYADDRGPAGYDTGWGWGVAEYIDT